MKKKRPKRVNREAIQAEYKKLIRKRKRNVSRMVDAMIEGEVDTYQELKRLNEDLNADIDKIEKAYRMGV